MTRTLLLAPSPVLAQPRGWQTLAQAPLLPKDIRYDEVHCVGGGYLLLWLLACAHRAPRGRVVYLHGPVVLPTPESCASWLSRDAPDLAHLSDEYEWRQQAVTLGVGGRLQTEHNNAQWLTPLLKDIATGRSNELGVRASDMQRRWERNGRLIHRPLPAGRPAGQDVLDRLLHGQRFEIDVRSGGEAPPTLLQCCETECSMASIASL